VSCCGRLSVAGVQTLSRITNGPLIPPIVLYRILGVTDIIRGSREGAIFPSPRCVDWEKELCELLRCDASFKRETTGGFLRLGLAAVTIIGLVTCTINEKRGEGMNDSL